VYACANTETCPSSSKEDGTVHSSESLLTPTPLFYQTVSHLFATMSNIFFEKIGHRTGHGTVL
jgi:hypothetical protein